MTSFRTCNRAAALCVAFFDIGFIEADSTGGTAVTPFCLRFQHIQRRLFDAIHFLFVI